MMAQDDLSTTTTATTPSDVGSIAGGIILAAWILASNITLIFAILRSDRRRKVSFNLHVCNLSVVSLLMGGLVLPLYIDYALKGQWVYSDNLCRLWLLSDMMVCSVSVLAVGMMIFDRFVLFSCPDAAEGGCKFVFSATLIILPWALGSSIVLPVYLIGESGNGIMADKGICFLDMEAPFAITYELAGFAVPGLAAFGLLVATSLTWCVKREELRDMDYSEEREHKGWQVFTSWIICLAVLGMWLPFSALHVLMYLMDRTWPQEWMHFAMWLAYINSGINPLLWMIMPRLRYSVRALCCCCPSKNRYGDDTLDDETGASMIEFHEK